MSGAFSGAVLTTPQRRAGTISVTLNGDAFDVRDWTYDATSFTREELDAQNAPAGYSEKPKFQRAGGTIIDAASLTVASIMAMQNITMTMLLASGKTVQGDNMSCIECAAVKTEDATFEVMFIGSIQENPI
jgi:hypothetical protein